jgi:hypothetical protein
MFLSVMLTDGPSEKIDKKVRTVPAGMQSAFSSFYMCYVVLGWCLVFLPVMLTDGPSDKIDKKVGKALFSI